MTCTIRRILRAGGLGMMIWASSAAADMIYEKDWEMACDNTHTCRAVGYSLNPEEVGEDVAGWEQAAVLLVRKAGKAPLEPAQVRLQYHVFSDREETAVPRRVRLLVNGEDKGEVALDEQGRGKLSVRQTMALVRAVLKELPVRFEGLDRRFVAALSSDGAKAVLMKMDEVQGRSETPLALAKKGGKPLAGLIRPATPPRVFIPPLPVETTADRKHFDAIREDVLKAIQALHKALNARYEQAALRETTSADADESEYYCDDILPERLAEWGGQVEPLALYRLSEDKLLASGRCWLGAYNMGRGYWIVEDKPPYRPVVVTDSGGEYENGIISHTMRGRGIGDCYARKRWAWNGKRFVKVYASSTGSCRGFVGGAWELPEYVATTIRGEARKTSAPQTD